nr:hypothetical protein I302_00864 [Kwoniella bestiolae CBS 10118]OCF29362.1 hypothetical protein I302_00864 [Kwoniella bestiolae CBS 10118]
MNVDVPTYSPPTTTDEDENGNLDRRVIPRSLNKRFNWEFHHYHFLAESLLGGIASLDLVRAGNNIALLPLGSREDKKQEKDQYRQVNNVERYSAYRMDQEIYDRQWLFIPWEEDWRDAYGLNEPIVKGLFDHRFVDAQRWNETTDHGDWVGFERVVIIDRWSSHLYNTLANQWNKMALDVFSLLPSIPPPDPSSSKGVESIFSPYRDRFLGYMNIQSLHRHKTGTALHEIPKIVYVDRQSSSRRLLNGTHDDLLDVLDGLDHRGKAKIQVGRLEEMSYGDQIRLFADADIIIGVHGNGLTHQVWMAPGGIIIEIFPPGVFLRDYQLIAQVVGHEHIAILDSQIYTKQEWENEPGKLLASRPDEANDRNITLSKDFIEDLLYLKLTNYQVVL